MVMIAGLIHQKQRLAAHVIHTGRRAAIIPQIPNRQTATCSRFRATWPGLPADVLKSPTAGIPIQKPGLPVCRSEMIGVDLGINVAVDSEDVGAPVIVDIDKHRSPTQEARIEAQTGFE